MVNQSAGTGLPGAVRAAVDVDAALDAVPDNSDTAMSARRRERMNRALERIEIVRLPVDGYRDRTRVFISTGLAACHGALP